jgi:hypothetical protein
MDFRFFDKEKDYETLCDWWRDWNVPVHPPQALSSNGIIVSRDGVDICSGFLYSTDSYFCWIEFVTMNKKATKAQREGALELLGTLLINKAKFLGFSAVWALGIDSQDINSPKLAKWRRENMNSKINHNISQYYKRIN